LLVEGVEGAKKPYIFDGVIYFRAGTQTRPANSVELLNLIHNRSQAEAHWERQAALGVEFEDLEYLEIRNTLNYLKETGRGKFQAINEDNFLNHYGLVQNGSLTNAALVLFAKEPTRFLPQCRVRITVFPTDKTGERYEFDRILEGNLFRNVEEIQNIFETIFGNYSTFSSESWIRTDRPKYPLLALREGILNALIHKDYSNVSGGVSVSIYPDRLEISNYGELPDELTANDLKRNHPSLPRNPDIAHIFFLRGLIEQIGRGTLYILEHCQKVGLKAPQWVSKSGITTLTFFNDKIEIIDVEHLNERQLKLIALLESGTQITANEYFKFIDEPISERSARNDLATLVKGNWLKKQGQAKNTIYVRTEKQ
jgi:ATP-dependent DNA helicase RecG